MFTLRGILVSCSVFVILYLSASLLISVVWRLVGDRRGSAMRVRANALYALRMAPLLLSLAITFGLVVPSFLRFEPRAGEEEMGPFLFALSLTFLLLVVIGILRGYSACSRTRGWVEQLTAHNSGVKTRSGLTVVDSQAEGPAVALAGIRNPSVLISPLAKKLLTDAELECAIQHELAHARAHDNLKKLLIHVCAFPGTSGLERAFLDATEFAADASVAGTESAALDLASALVKIARVQPGPELPTLASGLGQSPKASLEARVEHLIHVSENRSANDRLAHLLLAGFGLATAAVVFVSYGNLLMFAHRATELLVR